LLLAEAYLQRERLPQARAALDRQLARVPADLDVRQWRGLVALRMAHNLTAAEDFSSVLAAEPSRDSARLLRARAWMRLGRFQEALADLGLLIQARPKDVELLEMRSEAHERLGHSHLAAVDKKSVAAVLGPSALLLNNRAWALATGSAFERDPERALRLARMAAAASPEQMELNTLGVALYRAGQFAEAIATLVKSLAGGKGEFDGFNLFPLAMAHQRLGHREAARDCFDRAVLWLGNQQGLAEQDARDLAAFRAEAEAVLALSGPGAELPADVFAPE
jgi:tetratricopeptide (TPR) repeat protein